MQSDYWQRYVEVITAGCLPGGGTSGPVSLIPADRADARLLLDAHVVLKALYEVRYELANRPAWVGWPLAAVVQMIEEGSAGVTGGS